MSKKHYDKSSGSRCSADDVTYKRIRLTDLKRGRYASTNAIAHLLDTVRRQGIPECSSASAQRRARVALCSQATPFGPIVQQLEVPAKHDPARAPTNVSIPYQNPLAVLHVSVHECEPLAELMRDAVRTHGEPSLAAPWRLIWYFDEIGQSPLATVDTRKTYGTYWSFFGIWSTDDMHGQLLACCVGCPIHGGKEIGRRPVALEQTDLANVLSQ